MEKSKTENLTAWITGRNLNIYQKADAVIEHNKLLEYVSDLENQSTSQKETVDRFREFVNWAINQDDYGSISGRTQFIKKANRLLSTTETINKETGL